MDSAPMKVDFSGNFFELFQLPVKFDISRTQLIDRFRELQKQLHPDKFAAAAQAERLWSVQAASFVNEGYQTLDNNLRRASYLLQINGVSIDEETDTQMAPDFLMQQMELRESLEAVSTSTDPIQELDRLAAQIKSGIDHQMTAFAESAAQSDWTEGRSITRQWQFLDKLQQEIKAMEEQLDA